MKKLFLITLLLASEGVLAGVSENQVEATLAKYCISKPAEVTEDGQLTCNGIFEATYKKDSGCDCASSGDTPGFKHLVYDKTARRCKPRCPAGYYIQDGDGTKCPAGQYQIEITK